MNTSPLVPAYWREQGIEQVLIDEASIARRVRELGHELSLGAADGKDVVLIAVLTGAVVFAADLMRSIPTRVAISMVNVTSYGASSTSKGAVLSSALPKNLAGKHVIIVDEVLDSGGTLRLLRTELSSFGVASLRACVLLRKQREQAMSTKCEMVGFDIPDVFVVGYGLDFNDEFRNMPFVGVLGEDGIRERSLR
ncbi:MAG: phosphoribosyltransferase family protein [Planctomycetota bacterium]|nr:phosphoribosyltransferase family protein [Planctomycetota bacterium]